MKKKKKNFGGGGGEDDDYLAFNMKRFPWIVCLYEHSWIY